jgi:hypothetical protein
MLPDPIQTEALTVKLTTGESEQPIATNSTISQYLATIGRKGGIKGGKARAKSLSDERKKEIARLAAQARWKDNRNGPQN